MTAEIFSVGTELLLGDIVNTNAAFLSKGLANLGIAVYNQSTVGDNVDRLLLLLESAFAKADMVIASGGIGPTQDDITKVAAALYFGRKLVTHDESLQRIKKLFIGRKMCEQVHRNAIIPEGCDVLPNDHGCAPGIVIEEGGKLLILLPGPPHEMEPMFLSYVVPILRKKTDGIFLSRTLKIIGTGECEVESLLRDLIDTQTNPTIAPYAKMGEVHLRLTASAPDENSAKKLINPVADEIYSRLSPNIYGEDDDDLAAIVVDMLKSQNLTVATAESCTGGLVASALVSVPGCSDVFCQGMITYANDAKISRLGVDAHLLKKHGAVSPQVAAAMAEGAAQTSGTSLGLSTTGIAGPGGGTLEKPVGLVYVGLCRQVSASEYSTKTASFRLSGCRNEIRIRAANMALDMLRREVCLGDGIV